MPAALVALSPLLQPELATLVEACRWPFPVHDDGRLADLASGVGNWNLFLDLVDRHRVAGLCHAAMSARSTPMPRHAGEELGRRARSDAHHELALLRETLCLTGRMGERGIACRVLKGAVFAQMLFGRFGVRYSTDIDLLVSPTRLEAAVSVLRSLGYAPASAPETDDPVFDDAVLKRRKDICFTHRETGIVVELHWRLFVNPHVFPGAERSGVATIELPGGARLPALEASLSDLYLCFHGAEHAWSRLKWIADLGAAMSARDDMACRTYETARRMGRHRMVGPGLYVCHRFYGHPIPSRLVEDISRDRRMRFQIATAFQSLVGDGSADELEDRALATTRKNLCHYLLVNDPRHFLAELRYDATHREPADNGSKLAHRLGQVWRMLSSSGANM